MNCIGVCSWAFAGFVRGRRSYAEMTRLAAEAGFTGIEAAYTRRAPQPPADRLAVPMASLATLELHRCQLTAPQPARSSEALAILREMIAFAAAAGIPSVSFSPGTRRPETSLNQAIDGLAATLAPAAEAARQQNVALAIENLPGHAVMTREAMDLLMRRQPGLRVCLDVGNALACPPIESWIDAFGAQIVKIHISDGALVGGELKPMPLGTGGVDWPAVRKALRHIENVPVFAEIDPVAGDERAHLLAARRFVEELVA